MKFFVGLGNPGKKYDGTRHNIGFAVIDRLAEKLSIPIDKHQFNADYGTGIVGNEKVILFKPQTYMNLSGEAVRPFLDYYCIDRDDMLVIYDDLDLPLGKLRLRQKGSAGGHNGMKSIIDHVGSGEFKRMRFGIGRPKHPHIPIVDFVLSPFDVEERPIVEEAVDKAVLACEKWITAPFLEVMNEFN